MEYIFQKILDFVKIYYKEPKIYKLAILDLF